MTDAATCAHCGAPIVDPTTQVVHGARHFCCANCSAAMERTGSGGSDPQSHEHAGALRCARCGCAIVDESTLVSRGDQAFCCGNCARAMAGARQAGA
jgi:hypothetical protein